MTCLCILLTAIESIRCQVLEHDDEIVARIERALYIPASVCRGWLAGAPILDFTFFLNGDSLGMVKVPVDNHEILLACIFQMADDNAFTIALNACNRQGKGFQRVCALGNGLTRVGNIYNLCAEKDGCELLYLFV